MINKPALYSIVEVVNTVKVLKMEQNNNNFKIENKNSFGYTYNKRAASGRELSLPRPKRTSDRLVPPEAICSSSVNRVLSLEDLYKATLEQAEAQNSNQKEV